MRPYKRALWMGKRGTPSPTPTPTPSFVDHIIGLGSGSATVRTNNTVEISLADTPYPVTRNGLTFGVAGTFTNNGGSAPGGTDGRFKTALNGNGTIQIDLPNGTYTVRAAMGVDFTPGSFGLRIRNTSGLAALHTLAATASAGGGNALDITGVDRVVANWDATNASVSIVVTGGAGVIVDRGAAGSFFLNYIRFQQTA